MPKGKQPIDRRLLTKVSRYYYEETISESEIATRLNLSRSKVSRLLKEARMIGIVHISVVPPPGIYVELEARLEKKFNLLETVVVDIAESTTPDTLARQLGLAAARHLQMNLMEGEIIGISWGRTLSAMANAIQPQRSKDNLVIQIIGGLGPPTSEAHATEVCWRMANALSCDVMLLPAPGIVVNKQVKEAFLQDLHVQQNLQRHAQIDVAYVGIGAPTPDSVLLRDGSIMTQSDVDLLTAKGAVGDIALPFFDASGKPIEPDLDERVIGITLEQLNRIKRVIGIAGGQEKLVAIHSALLGAHINVLITDQYTARQLLN